MDIGSALFILLAIGGITYGIRQSSRRRGKDATNDGGASPDYHIDGPDTAGHHGDCGDGHSGDGSFGDCGGDGH